MHPISNPVQIRYRKTESFAITTTTIVTTSNGSATAPTDTLTGSILPVGNRLLVTYRGNFGGSDKTIGAHIDGTGRVFSVEIEDERFRTVLEDFLKSALPQFKNGPIRMGDSVYQTKQDVGELFGGFAATFAKDVRPSDISGDLAMRAIGLTKIDNRDGLIAKFTMNLRFNAGIIRVSGVSNGYSVFDLRSGLVLESVQNMSMTIRAKNRTEKFGTHQKQVTTFD